MPPTAAVPLRSGYPILFCPWCGCRSLSETTISLLQRRRGGPIQVCPWCGFRSETAIPLLQSRRGVPIRVCPWCGSRIEMAIPLLLGTDSRDGSERTEMVRARIAACSAQTEMETEIKPRWKPSSKCGGARRSRVPAELNVVLPWCRFVAACLGGVSFLRKAEMEAATPRWPWCMRSAQDAENRDGSENTEMGVVYV